MGFPYCIFPCVHGAWQFREVMCECGCYAAIKLSSIDKLYNYPLAAAACMVGFGMQHTWVHNMT